MGKTTCKVFTPLEIVNRMLDKIGYVNNLHGKKVLENSCGTGRFLCEIARRYIIDAKEHNRNDKEIISGLELDIYGIEKEKDILEQCIMNLDDIAASFGLRGIKWNVRLKDTLNMQIEPIFDFVVGNPPYITYYNLTENDRELIRSKFEVCEIGKADYYYAFTEAALKSLIDGGKMAYLIPNNFMKNRFSEKLRQYMLPHLTELIDYRDKKIFESYLTSSAIIICEKKSARTDFLYVDVPGQKNKIINKSTINGKWAFYLHERKASSVRFGEYFQVSAPVATLCNDAFVLNNVIEENEKYILYNNHYIEKAIVRTAASPKTKQKKAHKTYIIFPYRYHNGKRLSYSEADFKTCFPHAYTYLGLLSDRLLKRKKDKSCQWFEYGRTQALDHINQEKLILSTLITDRIRCYWLDKETVPFSGMYIVPKGDHSLREAEEILNSQSFLDYIKEIGISVSGSSYRISPRDVKDYVIQG